MTQYKNPFSCGSDDRQQIWTMLVERDIDCFLRMDWQSASADFAEDGFTGYSGSANPDHWNITFPNLGSYGAEWMRQAEAFSHIQLKEEDNKSFLYRAIILRDIDLNGDRAAAHKKFDGRAITSSGTEVVLKWQTVYWLQRIGGTWKITGFLGYLPNPMPEEIRGPVTSGIRLLRGAVQHLAAGPYSPVLEVTSRTWITVSGQGPIDSAGAIVGKTLEEQAVVALEGCKRQLEAAGASMADVFKVTVYLADIGEWNSFNDVYRRYFEPPYPTRTAIQASLWGGVRVEVDLLAVSPNERTRCFLKG